MLTNPIYAGAYVYGRRETRTKIDRTGVSVKPNRQWVLASKSGPSRPSQGARRSRGQCLLVDETETKSGERFSLTTILFAI
jgi:hypothetical protein